MLYTKPHQKLEEYFAKQYTEKYIEFGGYFHLKPFRTYTKSPMEKYFFSGKYKDLNDPQLEALWLAVRWRNYHLNIAAFIIFIIILIINYFK